MKKLLIVAALALSLSSCIRREYRIVHVEAIGNPVNDYYVVYTVNDRKVEAILDGEQLAMLQEVADDHQP